MFKPTFVDLNASIPFLLTIRCAEGTGVSVHFSPSNPADTSAGSMILTSIRDPLQMLLSLIASGLFQLSKNWPKNQLKISKTHLKYLVK
jgi:hypothetical protein